MTVAIVRASTGSQARNIAYLARLTLLAGGCGVTRLADITDLDDIGLPVWQAIRPAGLSLSVHQGKGRNAVDARIGALSEAIECHSAERVQPDGPLARFCDLAPAQRAPRLSDYGRSRELRAPRSSKKMKWCTAVDVITGNPHYLPHDLVALDFTRLTEPWFERSSTGLGAGPSEAHALRTALCEVIERDAVGEWEHASFIDRINTAVPIDSVPFSWFQMLRDKLESLGTSIRLFAPQAIVEFPVLVCWIEGTERFGDRWRRFGGSGAHGSPQEALFRAVAEALQSRLTFVATVRDDMLPSAYYAGQRPSVFRLPPLPPGAAGRHWNDIPVHAKSASAIAEALVEAGYPQVVAKRLEGKLAGVAVVKAFVPGLGSLTRTRAR